MESLTETWIAFPPSTDRVSTNGIIFRTGKDEENVNCTLPVPAPFAIADISCAEPQQVTKAEPHVGEESEVDEEATSGAAEAPLSTEDHGFSRRTALEGSNLE